MSDPRAPGRVLVIRQGRYPLDPRVRRAVGALLAAGHEVDVLCARGPGEPLRERAGALRVLRLPVPLQRGGTARYLLQYGGFLIAAALVATALALVRRYRLVQVHSLPDTLVFAAAGPRLLGARVLLDLHECMPEFFATRFGVPLGHPAVRAIARAEQASIAFADRVVTCTDQMREAFAGRGADAGRIAVVLNAADEEVFGPGPAPGSSGGRGAQLTLVTHGSLEPRYGVDTAIHAVALLAEELPQLRLEVYGDGTERDRLRELARALGVAERVRFSEGWVPIDELVAALRRADAGVVAMRRDAFRDLTHCNKMYDLIAVGTPVITSRTRSVEAYFPEDSFLWFDSGDPAGLAAAVRRLAQEPALGERLAANARRAAEPYRWPHQRDRYLAVVGEVVRNGRRRVRGRERAHA